MACRVIRDENNNVTEVFASNGAPSILWNDLVRLIEKNTIAENEALGKIKTDLSKSPLFGVELKDLGIEPGPTETLTMSPEIRTEIKNKAYEHYLSLRTTEFKNWFGDWENDPANASKVVDENNEPKIVYHGSPVRFNTFKQDKDGNIYFAEKISQAEEYTDHTPGRDIKSQIIPAFLNIRNPKESLAGVKDDLFYKSESDLIDELIEDKPSDGTMYITEHLEWIIKDPNQVKHAIDNLGNYSKQDNNTYQQLEPSAQHEMDEKLNDRIKKFLDELGIPIQMVQNLTDNNGMPMRGIAKADMLHKIVQVVEDKADISTLPEEAAHFFVEIIKKTDPKLYDRLFNNIDTFAVYQNVIDTYGKLEGYEGNENKLKDEAIGKLIANEIVQQHLENENKKKLPWVKRWLAEVIESVRRAFGKVFGNPYRTAAYQMMTKEASQYKDVVQGLETSESYLQADPAEATPTETLSQQDKTVKNIIEGHRSIQLDANYLKSAIKGNDYKILRTLMDQDSDGEFGRYIIEDADGKITMITNRTTDEGTRQFIKKVGKLRAQEINQSDRAAHARKNGTKFHGEAQNLIEKMAVGNKDMFEVIETTSKPGSKSYKDIQKASGLNNELFSNFKNGVRDLLNTIEKTQNQINSKEGTSGKVKIMTEVRLYDPNMGPGTGTAGTVDLLVVYSDGTVGIFDWKFMTPQFQYTEGFGKNKTLIENPFSIKMDGWNTQIGAYKKMLKNIHGIENKNIRQSRIIPAHVDYKVKDFKNKDFTKTDEVEVFQMSDKQNPYLAQIAVAREWGSLPGINRQLNSLYKKRDKLSKQMKNVKGLKSGDTYASVKGRYLSTLKAIQQLTVKENLLFLVQDNIDHITRIQEHIHKNDPTEDGYLTYDDLLNMLEDLVMFESLNADSVGYINKLRNDPNTKDIADETQDLLAKGAREVETNIALVRDKMFERLIEEAKGIGENIEENPLKLGFFSRNTAQMDEIDHPVFRTAYNEINIAFNKTKQVTDSIFENIMKKQSAVEAWAKKNNMSLADAFKTKLIKDTIVKNEQGVEEIKSRNLVPKFGKKFYDEIKKREEAGDVAWFRKHFQLKDSARETYERRKKNKRIELESIKNEKEKESAFKNFDRFNNFWVNDDAWIGKFNRWTYLELKNPTDFHSEEYQELSRPENKALLDFYEMYQNYNKDFQNITGKSQLRPGFIANRKDGIMETIINNGFDAHQFFDSIKRPFLTHEEEQTMGVREDGGLVNQIPIAYMEDIRDSKNRVDHSLKSLDLGKSLYALSLSVYNYKHMAEVEAKVLALKDFLVTRVQETDTTMFGSIKQDEAGQAKLEETSQETLATFDRFVKYYIYGQKIQDKRNIVAGIDLIKVIPALQSIYSLKVLSFAVVPGIAARAVGGINMYLEGIDGVNYTKKQMSQAHKDFATNYKAVVSFAEFFDPYQSGLSWIKMRDLSMKKAAKYFNLDNAYYPLRAADENMDTMIAVAMAKNHGIDKEGNIQRMEDLLMEDSKAKSMWDHYLLSYNKDDGSFTIPGLTDTAFIDFRRRVKEVAGKIKGEMSDENIVAAQTQLMGKLLLQFKSWMPGLVSERFKGIKYNRILKTLEEGRYIGFVKGANWGREMLEEDRKFHVVVGHTLNRGLEAVQHLIGLKKFTTNPAERDRLQKAGKWTDKMEKDYQRRTDALKREYENWRRNTPGAANISNPNEFLKMRQRSVRRTLAEVRAVLMIYAALAAMGIGDDEEELRKRNFMTRKLNMVLNRIAMELGFTLNPLELTKFLRGGIPLAGLFVDAINVVSNGVDETGDMLGLWKDSGHDKTGPLYYTTKFVPGAHQLGRFFSKELNK